MSILDTPGLDSPSVWRQIHTLVRSKAFMFVWVGALDSPSAFGLQGRRLVDLYRSTGHPLPPLLVLTRRGTSGVTLWGEAKRKGGSVGSLPFVRRSSWRLAVRPPEAMRCSPSIVEPLEVPVWTGCCTAPFGATGVAARDLGRLLRPACGPPTVLLAPRP